MKGKSGRLELIFNMVHVSLLDLISFKLEHVFIFHLSISITLHTLRPWHGSHVNKGHIRLHYQKL